jgi:hypothetical protein
VSDAGRVRERGSNHTFHHPDHDEVHEPSERRHVDLDAVETVGDAGRPPIPRCAREFRGDVFVTAGEQSTTTAVD